MQNMPVVFVVAPLAAATDDTATSFNDASRVFGD
jgi:hypothetical protein